MTSLNRRNFIMSLTAMMGGALTPVGAKAFDATVGFVAGGEAKTLMVQQLRLVELMADIIIPTTDTPGAAAARVHYFIDHMVTHFMTKSERAAFLQGLDSVNSQAEGFAAQSAKIQKSIVSSMDNKMLDNPFYRSFKELTVTGYYTSEIGASQELLYDPVPGPYHEVPFSEIGRAWAT